MNIELQTIQPVSPPPTARTTSPSPDRASRSSLHLNSPFPTARSADQTTVSIPEPDTPHRSRSSSPASRLSLNPGASLAPVDRGRAAFSFLAAATVIEMLVWGLPFSVGILHSYWTTELFKDVEGAEATLTLAATLQTGFLYLSALVFGPLLQRFPTKRVHLQAFGLLVAMAGLIGSAFATKPMHLVVTLGILFPFSCLAYLPCATLIFQWFAERRGIASGIMYGGTGAGGTVFPFIVSALLKRFSYKASMIALGLCWGLLGAIALCFIKPRLPVVRKTAKAAHARRRFDGSFLKRSSFWAFGACILASSCGNFLPSVFLPQYAHEIGSKPDGTSLIAIMNASSVPGLLLLGWLTDRIPLRIVILVSCLGAALSSAFLWGFAESNAMLVAFSVTFGLTALGFTSVWTKLITVVSKDDPRLPSLLFALYTGARGVGSITSGPIASALLAAPSFDGAKGAYGRDYGPLLVYSSCAMAVGAVAGCLYRE